MTILRNENWKTVFLIEKIKIRRHKMLQFPFQASIRLLQDQLEASDRQVHRPRRQDHQHRGGPEPLYRTDRRRLGPRRIARCPIVREARGEHGTSLPSKPWQRPYVVHYHKAVHLSAHEARKFCDQTR